MGRPTTVVYVGTSLDGFIARPDGAIDWLGSPPEPGGEDYGFAEFIATIDALVIGRRTTSGLRTDGPTRQSDRNRRIWTRGLKREARV